METMKTLRIVLCGPRDVQPEIERIKQSIETVNRLYELDGVLLRPYHWKTHAHADYDPDGAQPLIDSGLKMEEADAVVVVFWQLYGSPVKDAGSGTEHELVKAIKLRKASNSGRPRIICFFKNPGDPERIADREQWCKLKELKKRIQHQVLWIDIGDDPDLEHKSVAQLGELAREWRDQGTPKSSLDCRVSSSPSVVRAEGLTERVGDIVFDLQPTGGAVLASKATIMVTLSTNITNRITMDNLTDAYLECGHPTPSGELPISIRAMKENDNTIRFTGVPILARQHHETQRFRIRNIRAAIAGGSATNGLIFAHLGLSTTSAKVSISPEVAPVARVRQGLGFRVISKIRVCSKSLGLNEGFASSAPPRTTEEWTAVLEFSEKQVGAFTTQNEEAPRGTLAISNSGTGFHLRFTNVPKGVEILVSTKELGPGLSRVRLAPQGHDPLDLIQVWPTTEVDRVHLVSGSGSARWEWIGPRREQEPQSVQVGTLVVVRPGEAETGAISINGSLAPISSVNTMSGSWTPIPRFADQSTAQTFLEVLP